MSTTWILVADSAKARLFAMADHSIAEIEDFLNPEGMAYGQELLQGRPATPHDHYSHGRHATELHTGLLKKSAETFARELDEVLERGRTGHQYQDVVLVAPAHFLGTLNANLNKSVRACVKAEVPRNLTRADAQTIMARLSS